MYLSFSTATYVTNGDYDLQDFLAFPVATTAASMGVSEELATYRLQSVQPTLYPELWE